MYMYKDPQYISVLAGLHIHLVLQKESIVAEAFGSKAAALD